MATPEGLKGEITEEIRKLSVAIDGYETELRSAVSEVTKNILMELITATRNTLNIEKQRLFALEQQGKFHHIFPLSFPNLLDVTHCPITLDISSSPILVMQIRKVRVDGYCDGYYCGVVVQCSRKRVSRTNNPSYVIRSFYLLLFSL